MLKPECLNPKEVLAHLNSLGYQDVTPEQLKEFIHDLKKLIKYEQKQASMGCVKPYNACDQTESANLHCSECGFTYPGDDLSDKLSSNESYCESSASSFSTSATYSQRNNESKRSGRNTADTDISQKAHTSFIRPWNLQGCKDLSARGKRNPDPVRLYHQYKEFWKSQHIPGERTRITRNAHDICAVFSEDLQMKTWINKDLCFPYQEMCITLDILFSSIKNPLTFGPKKLTFRRTSE